MVFWGERLSVLFFKVLLAVVAVGVAAAAVAVAVVVVAAVAVVVGLRLERKRWRHRWNVIDRVAGTTPDSPQRSTTAPNPTVVPPVGEICLVKFSFFKGVVDLVGFFTLERLCGSAWF